MSGMKGDDLEILFNTPLFVCLFMISILIVGLNIYTIIVIRYTKQLEIITRYLMVSLSVADTCVGISTLIPLLYATFTDRLTRLSCDVMGFVSSLSWAVSVYTLMLITVDRYIAIVYPLRYQTLSNRKICLLIVLASWIFSAILWILPVVGVGANKFNDEEVACYFDVVKYPIQWMIYMAIIFVPTSVVIAFTYIKLYKISRMQKRAIEAVVTQGVNPNKKMNFKALRTILIIVGAFYLAWTPFVVEHIVKAVQGKLEHIPEWFEISIFVVAVSNSFWNPLVYMSSNKAFQITGKNMWQKALPCKIIADVVPSENYETNVNDRTVNVTSKNCEYGEEEICEIKVIDSTVCGSQK